MESMTPGNISSLVSLEYNLFQVSVMLFVITVLINLIFWFTKNRFLSRLSWSGTFAATLVLTGCLVVRWINVGHVPYVKLYETFMFTAWAVAVVALAADHVSRSRLPSSLANLLVALTLIYIYQWPETSREGEKLVPALQSPWLDVHIATSFLSYAGFALSAGASVVYLLNRKDSIDELSYKLVSFAFPLLGLGIILGAVWAGEAWGRYWGWDPKETAALLTWLIYAGYLHARLVLNWRGVRASIFNLIGFAAVVFTWVGLNILKASSLHTYE